MSYRQWTNDAIQLINADFNRSADTHLIKLTLPCSSSIQLYLKDESTHPTGSLKHRLARSLFLYGLCNGWITPDTTIIETSSGSTAISEAYFAKMLGLPFIAVMPCTTSPAKIRQITFYGGTCHLVEDPTQIYDEARRLVKTCNGHYMDQFTYAERATDWRGNNNIAESIFAQMADEPHPVPAWIVMSAGTGGTSATLGRYLRYTQRTSRLCVVDPSNSVFYDFFHQRNADLTTKLASRIEGIGRPRVEPSFMPDIVDRMQRVPDTAAFATIHFLEHVLGRRCGGSTGTNVYGALHIMAEMLQRGETGSIVTLICDAGDRYHDTYYNPNWLHEHGYNIEPCLQNLADFYQTGVWRDIAP